MILLSKEVFVKYNQKHCQNAANRKNVSRLTKRFMISAEMFFLNSPDLKGSFKGAETHTSHIDAAGVHAVFAGVHQRAANSCRRVKNVAIVTQGKDDGEVYSHAARNKSPDFHSHLS